MALTTIKAGALADDAVDSSNFADGSIDSAHLADDAVTADKLADAINTSIADKAPLASPALTGSPTTARLTAGSATTTGFYSINATTNSTLGSGWSALYARNATAGGRAIGVLNAGATAETVTILENGTATFAGKVEAGSSTSSGFYPLKGVINDASYSAISATNVSAGARVFTANDGTTEKILFLNTGAGTFKNDLRVDHSGNAGSDKLLRLGNVNNTGTNSAHLWTPEAYYAGPTALDGSGYKAKIATATGNAYFAGGVNVGGTGAANTLDDYEEGTFTPTFATQAGGTTTVSYTTQTGRYTKIGDTVHFYLQLQMAVTAWGNGEWLVSGLPFSCWSSYNNPPAVASKIYWYDGSSYTYQRQYVDYRWDHWWNQPSLFAIVPSNSTAENDYRGTTATDLNWIVVTIHGTYFTN